MERKAQDVYRDALSLSEDEREELIRLLTMYPATGTTDPDVQRAALAEAERRHQAILDGSEKPIPGEDMMRELRDIVSA